LKGSPAAAGSASAPVFDVACLFDTFTFIEAPGATDVLTDFYGTAFFIEGDLYPAGTIPEGIDDFDPASVDPLGHWLCRGWFINRTCRQGHPDRPEPHVITHQEYVLARITPEHLYPTDSLSSSGLEGDTVGQTITRAVVGGTGTYHGAAGSVVQHTTGSNTTEGPNFRFEFTLSTGA
jgi:hypothetical protein